MSIGPTDRPISTVKEVEKYSNRFVKVYDNDVLFANGRRGTYLRIVESGGRPGVAALPLSDGLVGLVRTYRYPIEDWEWGIPRGFAHQDDPDESILVELREELGAEPRDLEHLVGVTPNSGLLSSTVILFVAHYDHTVNDPSDTDEILAVRWESPVKVRDEIISGQLSDSFTIAAMGVAAMKGLVGYT